jgi:hypothetical protein
MNLQLLGVGLGARKTLVVLGAGASRGASFVSDPTGVLPPLDRDFFQQLSRLPSSDESRRLLEFVRSEYGHELGLSMERFFSEADYTNRFHLELKIDRGPKVRRYAQALDDFYVALPALLERATSEECDHHSLLAEVLHAQDCIVSFNYDCVMDRALRDHAGARWDPANGSYGFPVVQGAHEWRSSNRGRPP